MVCSCGVVSKGCYVHATSSACILGCILGSSESAVFPLSGCGQFGRMLVAMSTGDQRSRVDEYSNEQVRSVSREIFVD